MSAQMKELGCGEASGLVCTGIVPIGHLGQPWTSPSASCLARAAYPMLLAGCARGFRFGFSLFPYHDPPDAALHARDPVLP